jgi:hypothetical protein
MPNGLGEIASSTGIANPAGMARPGRRRGATGLEYGGAALMQQRIHQIADEVRSDLRGPA